jgi:hypothetical protein
MALGFEKAKRGNLAAVRDGDHVVGSESDEIGAFR